jgi:hypothetical protein
MKPIRLIIVLGAFAVLGSMLPLLAADDPPADSALAEFTRDWRDDPVWFDGKAEIAEYEATRTIYGSERQYTATFMTNKEHADPETKTKSADGTGRSVFKFHAREDIPTQKYTYHYSTMVYVGTDDLKSLKLDMGSMEDCGASFKQIVNHQGELTWRQFSYFPNEGHREGAYEPPANFVFHDALPLVLRGFPFDEKPTGIKLRVLPDQTTTKWSGFEPVEMVVEHLGTAEVELPYGKVKAHHLGVGRWSAGNMAPEHQYWFAADPELRHVMVAYEGPDGITYRLKSLRREAYWVN